MPADDATSGRWRRAPVALALAVALAAALAGVLGCGSGGGSPSTATAKPTPVDKRLAKRTAGGPNFLVILMDDQATNSFKARYEPQTFKWIVDPGTRFANGLAAPPLCCPDRAGFLTGDYPHSSGVFSNHPGYSDLRGKGNTLPVWLARAGYRTALIGKYLNHYYGTEGLRPAPGWDTWFSQTNREQYYDYPVSDNGVERQYGSALHDYSSSVFSSQAADFITQDAHSRRPFFLWLTYNAPHGVKDSGPACGNHNPRPPKGGDARRLKGHPVPKPASFNERDVSDKPLAISKLPPVTPRDVGHLDRRWRCTLATMSAADQGVGHVMRALKRSGQLDNTIVFYMSDNGFYFGEHRILSGKQYPYEPGLRGALRGPRALAVPRPAAAGGLDRGVSRRGRDADDPRLRGGPSLLHAPPSTAAASTAAPSSLCWAGEGRWPADRGVLAEIAADQGAYSAIRTERWVYVRYDDAQSELYDLRRDPAELRNLAGKPGLCPDRGRARRAAQSPPPLLRRSRRRPARPRKATLRMIGGLLAAAGSAALVRLFVGIASLASIAAGAVSSTDPGNAPPRRPLPARRTSSSSSSTTRRRTASSRASCRTPSAGWFAAGRTSSTALPHRRSVARIGRGS